MAEETARKTRSRRSPAKDIAAASNTATSPVHTASRVEASASSDKAASPSIDLDSESDIVEAASLRESNRSRNSVNAVTATAAGHTAPSASKRPADLASELFNDDEAEAALAASTSTAKSKGNSNMNADDVVLTVTSRKRRRSGSDEGKGTSQPDSATFTTAAESSSPRHNAEDAASLQLKIRQLEMQLAESQAQAERNAGIINTQQNIFHDLHGQCICHICLEPSFRPCVLAPCGHVFCIHCLRSWFTKPLASEAAPPASWSQEEIERYHRSRTLKRKKICPSCRTELACPPVEVFLVKDMLEKVDEGLKLSKEANVDSQLAESSTAILSVDDKVRSKDQGLPKGAKLWEDIFDQDGPRRIIFDEMDGVPRCGSCGSEIFDGACSNPSCAIEYDDHSEYEDLRRGGYDDMDDFDSEEDEDGMGGPRYARRNLPFPLTDRLAEFEARHGRSERLHRDADQLDDHEGITYLDSSDNEHTVGDYTGDGRRRRARLHDDDEDEEEDDEEMDDFIVRDDEENYFDHSGSSDDEGSAGDRYARYRDEEDDFLPGPRRGGRRSAIEISDDEDEDEVNQGVRGSSVEYRGHRGGDRDRIADEDEEDEEDSGSLSEDEDMHSEGEDDDDDDDDEGNDRDGHLGSSTDSSSRRRRARIVDDEDDEDEDEDGVDEAEL